MLSGSNHLIPHKKGTVATRKLRQFFFVRIAILDQELFKQSAIVAEHQILIIIVEMHSVTLAVLPHCAVGTLTLASPLPIAELCEAILPHIPEIVVIDIALSKVCADTCATRDISIHTNRSSRHTRITLKRSRAHRHFVASKKTLATIRSNDFTLFSAPLDKAHQLSILLIGEL